MTGSFQSREKEYNVIYIRCVLYRLLIWVWISQLLFLKQIIDIICTCERVTQYADMFDDTLSMILNFPSTTVDFVNLSKHMLCNTAMAIYSVVTASDTNTLSEDCCYRYCYRSTNVKSTTNSYRQVTSLNASLLAIWHPNNNYGCRCSYIGGPGELWSKWSCPLS